MNKRLSLIIGAVLALLAVFLVRVYLNQQGEAIRIQEEKRSAQAQQNQVPVLIAKRDISPGTPLEPSMFEVAVAPANQIPPQTATSFEQVIGKEAVAPISKGEPIMLTKLSAVARRVSSSKTSSLSTATPTGKRAITIPVDDIASVGGMIKPGDNVDVICLLSIVPETDSKTTTKKEVIVPLFQNVSVLAVGEETIGEDETAAVDEKGKPKTKTSTAKTITLALSPQEANIIAFVQEQGKIRLVLRSPKDTAIETTEPISWETLLRVIMPKEAARRPTQPERLGPAETVEIFRGLKREVVPLSE